MVEKAIPEIEMPATFKVNPPMPDTKMTLAMSRLRLSSKLTLFSTRIFRPLAAITPKRAIDTPPITGVGIEWIKADTLPIKLNTTAKIAAPEIT